MQLTRRTMVIGLALLGAILLAGSLALLLLREQQAGAGTGRRATVPPVAREETATVQPATSARDEDRTDTPAPLSQPETLPDPSATPAPPSNTLSLTYTIDRSDVPPLYYQALTLRIEVGPVDDVQVTATDPAGNPLPVDYRHDRERQTVTVTTAGSELHLRLIEPQDPDTVGSFEKAALRGGARWAWSHSLDDNIRLDASIQALHAYGYRGTLYLIAKHVEDTREQDWIVDAPDIHRLLAEGWSIGNHTWDHTCDPAQIDRQTIISAHHRLTEVVAASPVPDYKITAFAAPCFKGDYQPLVREMVAEGTTSLQFSESGARHLLVVDPGATEYSADEEIAASFAYTMPVGRDPRLAVTGGITEAQAIIDWMSAHATADRHFWYNTFTHSGETEHLQQLAAYVYDNYGAGGSGEVWVAPADEIYSYLLVRDRSTISFTREQPSLSPP